MRAAARVTRTEVGRAVAHLPAASGMPLARRLQPKAPWAEGGLPHPRPSPPGGRLAWEGGRRGLLVVVVWQRVGALPVPLRMWEARDLRVRMRMGRRARLWTMGRVVVRPALGLWRALGGLVRLEMRRQRRRHLRVTPAAVLTAPWVGGRPTAAPPSVGRVPVCALAAQYQRPMAVSVWARRLAATVSVGQPR